MANGKTFQNQALLCHLPFAMCNLPLSGVGKLAIAGSFCNPPRPFLADPPLAASRFNPRLRLNSAIDLMPDWF